MREGQISEGGFKSPPPPADRIGLKEKFIEPKITLT